MKIRHDNVELIPLKDLNSYEPIFNTLIFVSLKISKNVFVYYYLYKELHCSSDVSWRSRLNRLASIRDRRRRRQRRQRLQRDVDADVFDSDEAAATIGACVARLRFCQ